MSLEAVLENAIGSLIATAVLGGALIPLRHRVFAWWGQLRQGKKQGGEHEEDAKSAARDLYAKILKKDPIVSAVTVDKSFNILGAMMMRTGWASSSRVLCDSCLVVKPDLENPGATET